VITVHCMQQHVSVTDASHHIASTDVEVSGELGRIDLVKVLKQTWWQALDLFCGNCNWFLDVCWWCGFVCESQSHDSW